jgi:hypothetical protein
MLNSDKIKLESVDVISNLCFVLMINRDPCLFVFLIGLLLRLGTLMKFVPVCQRYDTCTRIVFLID